MKLTEVLVRRDGITVEKARRMIDEAKKAMEEYIADGDMDSAFHVCQEFFGLEPDYLDELIPM